ncbi:cupin domain-containing protein [Paenibacillus cremeus]|uniref:cupin domain-containing protein n=1 Tax=Paenibacillus cremeus TaxID=2163881 RepID=UPI001C96A23E|nr:cupin domain-containing protein [Paenibacillus cremeus]
MFYFLVFVISWLSFVCFAQKKRFGELYPTILIAMIMSLSSDVVTLLFPLWQYQDVDTNYPLLSRVLLDDFGIYPVIAYFYVQSLPSKLNKWFMYTLIWSFAGISVEGLMLHLGYMVYSLGWSLLWSFVSNWIIFGLLTLHWRGGMKRRAGSEVLIHPSGRAMIQFQQELHPLDAKHPLRSILTYPGVTLFQGACRDNVESFLFILDPDAEVPTKTHEGYELHYVMDGLLSLSLNGQEIQLHEGQLFHFPSTTPHAFKNDQTQPVKLLSILIRSELNEQNAI